MALPVYSLTPFTMLDYPNYMACIIWMAGCNMRCSYCHNPDLIKAKGKLEIEEVLSFLHKRRGLLEGVVLSGGEATIWPDLLDLAQQIKGMGFAIKLDTNGTRPDVVENLFDAKLLDYIALDYKAPLEKFKKVSGISKFSKLKQTLSLLCKQTFVPFEVRTTVHTSLLDEKDIAKIIWDLEKSDFQGSYFIQNFRRTEEATLKNLPDQKRTLDISAIPQTEHFNVAYRNFS